MANPNDMYSPSEQHAAEVRAAHEARLNGEIATAQATLDRITEAIAEARRRIAA